MSIISPSHDTEWVYVALKKEFLYFSSNGYSMEKIKLKVIWDRKTPRIWQKIPCCFCQRQIPGGTKDKVLIGENSALRRTEECYMWTEKYIVLKNTSPVYLNIFYLIIVCRHVCVYVQPPPHFFFYKRTQKRSP